MTLRTELMLRLGDQTKFRLVFLLPDIFINTGQNQFLVCQSAFSSHVDFSEKKSHFSHHLDQLLVIRSSVSTVEYKGNKKPKPNQEKMKREFNDI